VRNSSLSTVSHRSPSRHNAFNLQAQRNIPVPVLVVLLKDVRHPLQADARLHEQVETQRVAPAPVVRLVQQRDEALREPVPEGDERFVELGVGDCAAVVGVEAVEEAAPRGEEAPQAAVVVASDNSEGTGEIEHTKIRRN
jgi:hypothetical protein